MCIMHVQLDVRLQLHMSGCCQPSLVQPTAKPSCEQQISQTATLRVSALQGTRPDLYHVLEVKNELYSTSSDAFYESFLSFHSYLREHRTSTEGKRCSCFLTVVMGPWIW